jgi:hypothetical protein
MVHVGVDVLASKVFVLTFSLHTVVVFQLPRVAASLRGVALLPNQPVHKITNSVTASLAA